MKHPAAAGPEPGSQGVPPTLSLIIPCLNEEENLSELLRSLQQQEDVELELIVVDGGSVDGSIEIARSMGVTVVPAERGRGRQMNEGAKRASHALLGFLHADSRIDDSCLLRNAVAELESFADSRTAGHFTLRFLNEGQSLAFHHHEQKSALNRKDVFGGDQGLLIRKDFFEELEGFEERSHFLEDKAMGRKILARGRMVTLPGRVGTSVRRFDTEGYSRRMLLTLVTMAAYEVSFRPFLEQARDIYRDHDDSRRLQLCPLFALLHRLLREESFKQELAYWFGAGRFARVNSWQVFCFGDSCLSYLFGLKRRPFLALHDRVFRPLTSNVVCDALTAVAAYGWFHATWLTFCIADKMLPTPPRDGEPGADDS